jgi:hypothetical protein
LQHSAIGQLRIAVAQARLLHRRGDTAKARDLLSRHAELVGRLGAGADAQMAREFL